MVEIVPFLPADYDEVMALWSNTEGLTLRAVDSPEAISRYLARNPDLSFVARDEGQLIGATLANATSWYDRRTRRRERSGFTWGGPSEPT